jgi:hypothetical protein
MELSQRERGSRAGGAGAKNDDIEITHGLSPKVLEVGLHATAYGNCAQGRAATAPARIRPLFDLRRDALRANAEQESKRSPHCLGGAKNEYRVSNNERFLRLAHPV